MKKIFALMLLASFTFLVASVSVSVFPPGKAPTTPTAIMQYDNVEFNQVYVFTAIPDQFTYRLNPITVNYEEGSILTYKNAEAGEVPVTLRICSISENTNITYTSIYLINSYKPVYSYTLSWPKGLPEIDDTYEPGKAQRNI